MDPDANLEEQRQITARIILGGDRTNVDDVDRLAELVVALDAWITSGGFLPRAWRKQ